MKLQVSLKSKCNGAKSLGVKGGRPLREVGAPFVCSLVRADFPRHFGAFFISHQNSIFNLTCWNHGMSLCTQ